MATGCFLNPFFRDFQFTPDLHKRSSNTKREERLGRNLSDAITGRNAAQASSATTPLVVVYTNFRVIQSVVGMKRLFDLAGYPESHFGEIKQVDKVTKHNL